MDLKDKVAFITGSTRGIGWETAKFFAKHGATVLINGVSNIDVLNARVDELKNTYNVESEGFLFNSGDPEGVKACYSNIFKKYKKLDILVNNAAIFEGSLLAMITQDKIDKMLNINIQGVLLNMQYASRLMTRNKSGSIVNLTSIMGRFGASGQVLYSGTKAAVIGMTYSAAKELAPLGIRVNAVAPGFIETDMVKGLPEEKYKETLQSIKMKRAGTAEDVAKAILFFASDISSYITGQVLGVDGGMLI